MPWDEQGMYSTPKYGATRASSPLMPLPPMPATSAARPLPRREPAPYSYFVDHVRTLIPAAVFAATLWGFYLGWSSFGLVLVLRSGGISGIICGLLGAGVAWLFASAAAGHVLAQVRATELLEIQIDYLEAIAERERAS